MNTGFHIVRCARAFAGGALLLLAAPAGGQTLNIVTPEGLNQPMTAKALHFLVSVSVARTGREHQVVVRYYNQAGRPFESVGSPEARVFAGHRDAVRPPHKAFWIIKQRDGSARYSFRVELKEEKTGGFISEAILPAWDDVANSYLRVEYYFDPGPGIVPGFQIFEFKLAEFIEAGSVAVQWRESPPAR